MALPQDLRAELNQAGRSSGRDSAETDTAVQIPPRQTELRMMQCVECLASYEFPVLTGVCFPNELLELFGQEDASIPDPQTVLVAYSARDGGRAQRGLRHNGRRQCDKDKNDA